MKLHYHENCYVNSTLRILFYISELSNSDCFFYGRVRKFLYNYLASRNAILARDAFAYDMYGSHELFTHAACS